MLFVTSKRVRKLEQRIAELEAKLDREVNYTYYDAGPVTSLSSYYAGPRRIQVTRLLDMIMAHLDLRLRFNPGREPGATLTSPAPSSGTR